MSSYGEWKIFMIKLNFLHKLNEEGKLVLVEPSEEICQSYLEKAGDCLKSAKILRDNQLYENSISLSYYAMYNSLTALLFRLGIKCENHSAAISLLNFLEKREDLFIVISRAKEERIDSQYYITSQMSPTEAKTSSQELLLQAEDFILQIKLLIKSLNTEKILQQRKNAETLWTKK